MARWNEDQERWRGHGDRYGEDERQFRAERGEEGSWRGRDWRDDEDRFREWRGERSGERGREWRDRERWMREREPGREWGREPARPDFGRDDHEPGGGHFSGYTTYGSRWYPERYGHEGEEWRRDSGPGGWWYGQERERTPVERIREGFRKLAGRGPKGYHRSDERVRDEVCERIARSGVDATDVEVNVEKGEVTLTGYAESRDDKRHLEDLAEDVFGVEEVHNHVRIRRGTQPPATGSAMTPATGTTGRGVAMSAQQRGTRGPSHQGQHLPHH